MLVLERESTSSVIERELQLRCEWLRCERELYTLHEETGAINRETDGGRGWPANLSPHQIGCRVNRGEM